MMPTDQTVKPSRIDERGVSGMQTPVSDYRSRNDNMAQLRADNYAYGGHYPNARSVSMLQMGPRHLDQQERLLSIVLGLLGALMLSRRLFLWTGVLASSLYFMYRGLSGRCPVSDFIRSKTAGTMDSGSHSEENFGERDRAWRPHSQPKTTELMGEEAVVDEVDEAVRDSFPASDPPASW